MEFVHQPRKEPVATQLGNVLHGALFATTDKPEKNDIYMLLKDPSASGRAPVCQFHTGKVETMPLSKLVFYMETVQSLIVRVKV